MDVRLFLDAQQLFADSHNSYLSAVSKILNFSLHASRDERVDDIYHYRDSHQRADGYSSEYVAKKKEEEATKFIEHMKVFEDNNFYSPTRDDFHLSINMENLVDEGSLSGPSSK
jgi:hypothetical protein